MRWTIVLRHEGENSVVVDVPIATIERGELPVASEVGLMHQEGKRILHCLQKTIVDMQCRAYFARNRACPDCRKPRNIKDYRSRQLQTVFGTVGLRLPRFNCQCEHSEQPVWFGSKLLPNRSTPEWIAMQSALGARIPYREAALFLSSFLPVKRRLNHGTIRNNTISVGRQIALEDSVGNPNDHSVASGSLAIDGTYVKGNRRAGLSRLHVIVGSLRRPRKGGATFAFVQQYKPHRQKLSVMWQRLGCQESTSLHVVTDGDTGLHQLVKKSFPGTTSHILDWFHIAMRLNAIERSIAYGLLRAKQSEQTAYMAKREMESIHHHLWHGDHDLVCNWLGTLVNRLECTVPEAYLDRFSPLRPTLDKITDLRKYLMRFQEEIVPYSIAHRKNKPVSTAPVESLINRLVNHRMNKSQRMRWSIDGAQNLLQVRVALVNRTLPEILRKLYPGFSNSRINEFPARLSAE